jgi:hypothetical protein
VKWSDGVTLNPRRFINVTQNITLKAEFAPIDRVSPRVTKVADGNSIELLTFRITNPSSIIGTNIIVSQISYFANAQLPADITKAFTIRVNN